MQHLSNMKTFNKKLINIILLSLIIISGLSNSFAQAASVKYTLLEPLPCIEGGGVTCSGGSGEISAKVEINTYIQYVFNLLIAVAGVAAVFMIVYGGFLYMTSDSWFQKKDGINKVRDAILGLLMVLSTYLIMRTVNPKLVEIPQTLVPPIQNLQTESTYAFFEKISQDADYNKFYSANAENQAKVSQIRTEMDSLSNQKQELEDELEIALLTGDSERYEQLSAEIAVIDEQIGTDKSGLMLAIIKQNFDAQANTVVPSLGTTARLKTINGQTETVEEALVRERTELKNEYQRLYNKYKAEGMNADDLAEISKLRYYADAEIQINYEVAKIYEVNIQRNDNQSALSKSLGDYLLGRKGEWEAYLEQKKTETKKQIDTVLEKTKDSVDQTRYEKLISEANEAKTRIDSVNII